jgi:peptidoglycan hydrolase-like protein with peptidoglycan-binding domain
VKVLDMAVGAYGPKVKQLQERLQSQGYEISSSEMARQFFGPNTRAVLLKWQKARGVPPTGVLDDGTSALLDRPSEVTGLAAARPSVADGSQRAMLRSAAAKRAAGTNPFVPTLAAAITSPADGSQVVGIVLREPSLASLERLLSLAF